MLARKLMMAGAPTGPWPFTHNFESGLGTWTNTLGASTNSLSSVAPRSGTYDGKFTGTGSGYVFLSMGLPETLTRAGKTIEVNFWFRQPIVSTHYDSGVALFDSAGNQYAFNMNSASQVVYIYETSSGILIQNGAAVAASLYKRFNLIITPTTLTGRIYNAAGTLVTPAMTANNTKVDNFTSLRFNTYGGESAYVDDISIVIS